jgi:uncharacterized protein (TIGR03437 family)
LGAVQAPLIDITQLGNDGYACSALPAGSLNGAFALVLRGSPTTTSCFFSDKAANAQDAGAVGVIFYQNTSAAPFSPSGLADFTGPTAMVSNGDGLALKAYIDANPGKVTVIDPAGIEQSFSGSNQLASYSSLGPSTGDMAIKPDLVATGGADPTAGTPPGLYLATQSYDPLGEIYSATGYAAADGTSFASPITVGAAAMVKQSHPGYTVGQIKSALVNSAAQDVTVDTAGNTLDVRAVGGGRLDAGAAMKTTITSEPATISFGALNGVTLPLNRQLKITNTGSDTASLTLAISGTQPTGVTMSLDKTTLTLAAGAAATVTVSLSGTVPAPSAYSGAVTVQSSGSTIRVPYLYLVGDGTGADLIDVGGGFEGQPGDDVGSIAAKLVDQYGVPVAGAPVTFRISPANSVTLKNASTATDQNGVASAEVILGPNTGSPIVVIRTGGQTDSVGGTIRPPITITSNGVVNAATFEAGKPVAPGSYITIFGSGLADFTDQARALPLPLAMDYTTVSFDVPSAQISVPGYLVFSSPTQINLQVPWELQGQTSAQVKVSIFVSNGNVVTVPLANYAPAFFETAPGVVAAEDVNNNVINSGNPAKRGQPAQLFANGLGPVNNQPASGSPASLTTLSSTKSPATVRIGGQDAPVSFSGLTPGTPGLYQVNVTVPQGLQPGTYPVNVTIGGVTSKDSNITVQ